MVPQSGNYYQVLDQDRPLSRELNKYFKRVNDCDAATYALVKSLPTRLAFPDVSDAFGVMPADAEAGGLVGVSVPIAATVEGESTVEGASKFGCKPNPYLWSSMPDPDDADRIIYFPRVTISSHYIRYGEAVNLDATSAPDWLFLRNADGSIRYFRYDSVRMKIPTEDIQRIREQHRPNGTVRLLKTISPQMRLALGRRYDWSAEDAAKQGLILPPKDSPTFRAARALFDLFNSLPIVPAHTLLRLLALRSPNQDKEDSSQHMAIPFLEWRKDDEGHRIIFHTDLIPTSDEFLPIAPSDPAIARLFR